MRLGANSGRVASPKATQTLWEIRW